MKAYVGMSLQVAFHPKTMKTSQNSLDAKQFSGCAISESSCFAAVLYEIKQIVAYY